LKIIIMAIEPMDTDTEFEFEGPSSFELLPSRWDETIEKWATRFADCSFHSKEHLIDVVVHEVGYLLITMERDTCYVKPGFTFETTTEEAVKARVASAVYDKHLTLGKLLCDDFILCESDVTGKTVNEMIAIVQECAIDACIWTPYICYAKFQMHQTLVGLMK
jgi:hypothetical protein